MRRIVTALGIGISGAIVAGMVMVAIPAEGAPNGGGPGDPLLLSRVNQAGPMTVLKTNGGFRILAKAPKRPPLMVFSPDSMPPLQVSSQARVENLNADLLDGFDASAFVRGSDLVAASAEANGSEFVVADVDTVVASVSLTPPSAGTVMVWSSGTAQAPLEGEGVDCSITTGTTVDYDVWQGWRSAASIDAGTVAGTRGFPVTGRAPFTANLVCTLEGSSASIGAVRGASMTAIFIPGP